MKKLCSFLASLAMVITVAAFSAAPVLATHEETGSTASPTTTSSQSPAATAPSALTSPAATEEAEADPIADASPAPTKTAGKSATLQLVLVILALIAVAGYFLFGKKK